MQIRCSICFGEVENLRKAWVRMMGSHQTKRTLPAELNGRTRCSRGGRSRSMLELVAGALNSTHQIKERSKPGVRGIGFDWVHCCSWCDATPPARILTTAGCEIERGDWPKVRLGVPSGNVVSWRRVFHLSLFFFQIKIKIIKMIPVRKVFTKIRFEDARYAQLITYYFL